MPGRLFWAKSAPPIRCTIRRSICLTVAGLLAICLAPWTPAALSAEDTIEESFLAGEAKMRAKLPVKQGKLTLTGIRHSGRHQFFIYSIDTAGSPLTGQQFKDGMASALTRQLCDVEESRRLSQLGATFSHSFFDLDGKIFAQIDIAPGDCK